MKRIGILVLMYVVGGISGVVYHSMTTGAVDRARIAALLPQTSATLAVADQEERTACQKTWEHYDLGCSSS
jgi:hypothetical protein